MQLPENDTPEAIAILDGLREAVRDVLAGLCQRDREAIVAAIYDSSRSPLTAAAFRKRLQRALANARHLWKRRYGDDGA